MGRPAGKCRRFSRRSGNRAGGEKQKGNMEMPPFNWRAYGSAAILILAGSAFAARPMNPWILRVSMPNKVRINLITLSSTLSVAYDAPNAALYEAWSGTYVNGTDNYNYSRGILACSYMPQGKILYKQAPGGSVSETPATRTVSSTSSPTNETPVTVWSATLNAGAVAVKPDYRGYTVDNTAQTVVLRYRLTAGTAAVDVEESPETAAGGLQRDFTFKGIPTGMAVSLLLTGNTINKASGTVTETWTATGTGKVETRDGKRYLVQDKDGQTRLIGTWN